MARKRKQTIIYISPAILKRLRACGAGRDLYLTLGLPTRRTKITRQMLMDVAERIPLYDWRWICRHIFKRGTVRLWDTFEVSHARVYGRFDEPSRKLFKLIMARAIGALLNLPEY